LDIDADYLRRVCFNGGRPAGATAASARLREGGGSSLVSRQSPCAKGDGAATGTEGRGKCFGSKTSLDRISDRETLRPAPARDGPSRLARRSRRRLPRRDRRGGCRVRREVVAVGCGADASLSELLRGSAGRCPPRE